MRNRYLVFILATALALLLAACGGEETAEFPAEPAQEAAEVESAAEETAVEVAEPEPTMEPEPTEEPEPQATEAPPTAEPQPTAEAEEAQQAASGEGWGESGSTAQSACDHPYFPLRTGTTWTLSGEDGDPLTWEVLNVDGDMSSATAEMKMSSGEVEFLYTWECSGDGGLVSFDFGNQGMSALGPEVTIEVSEGTGMFLPAVEELVPGHTWETSYHSVYQMVQVEGDTELEIGGEMDTMQTSRVLSDAPVTFNGETVPGLLIQQDSEINMVMSMLGSEVNNTMTMGGEMELGWGLGMLRQTSFTDFGDFTMTATEIYVP